MSLARDTVLTPHAQSAPGRVRDQSPRVWDPTQTTRQEPLSVRPRENPKVKSHASRPPKSRDEGHPVAGTWATTAPQLRANDFPNFRDPDPAPRMIRTAAAAPRTPLPAPGLSPLSGAELTEPSPLRGSQVSTPTETRRAHAVRRPASRARTHADRPVLPGARSLAPSTSLPRSLAGRARPATQHLGSAFPATGLPWAGGSLRAPAKLKGPAPKALGLAFQDFL